MELELAKKIKKIQHDHVVDFGNLNTAQYIDLSMNVVDDQSLIV